MSKRKMKIPEAFRGAYKAARAARWEITRTGTSHLKWTPPTGELPVFTPATPHGGRHSVENSLSQLRRAGLTW